jgi:hypothetical protein
LSEGNNEIDIANFKVSSLKFESGVFDSSNPGLHGLLATLNHQKELVVHREGGAKPSGLVNACKILPNLLWIIIAGMGKL